MIRMRKMNQFLVLFLVSCLFFVSLSHAGNTSAASSASTQRCFPDQSSALLQLKREFHIRKPHHFDFLNLITSSYPKMKSWRENTDCCSWDGVTCNTKTGLVVGLNLSNSCLYGSLNSYSSLFSLRHLQKLNLAYNDFIFSKIPSEFGQLTRLTHLDLSQSSFSGQIPSELSQLINLVSLHISQNLDYDYNPSLYLRRMNLEALVKNMTNLEELHLDAVDISSSIPQFLVNLSSLTSLSLFDCGLLGEFPKNIFLLPKIQAIDLFYNDFLSGVLPEFPSGSSLKMLILSSTNFFGKVPSSIGNLKSLSILVLDDCNYSGVIPPSLGNLSHLIFLSLSKNNFHGQLPSTLGNLALLIHLELVGNILDGKIPSFLENLTQLTVLDLSYNNLNGMFPISLTNLTQLSYLTLKENQLIGPIPSEISRIVHLESLDLSNNSLTGAIPSEISGIVHLENLDLSYNLLTGAILPSLFTIPTLRFLYLGENQLVGPLKFQNISSSNLVGLHLSGNKLNEPIPSSIANLTNLQLLYLSSINVTSITELNIFFKLEKLMRLYLSGNNLSISNESINSTFPKFMDLSLVSCNIREFPNFLKTQDDLQQLDLSNNKIAGKIPKWFWNVGKEMLEFLNLSHNLFSSFEQPLTVLPWKEMFYLDLRSNLLQESLPIPPLSTKYFFASANNLTGRMPPTICKLSLLIVLDLSNNSLSGSIPQCLGNFSSSLSVLNLRMNNFQGKLPQTFTNGSSLRTLDFSHNQIQGKIPRSLVNCRELEVLNLGNNNMSDTFPFWLESLPELKILVLRENGFHGPIRHLDAKSGFTKLRIIDLSYNRFTGELPFEYFKTWNAMFSIPDEENSDLKYMGDASGYYKDSMTLMYKGTDMIFLNIITTLIAIDLSNNRLHGELPDTIRNLKALIVLNLSSNSFTGPIPSSLGSLTQLESLDLSHNKLSREIPQELTSLTFLEYLNLSQNQLVGPIPQGAQFGTFLNSSFEGNLGLCGSPLSKKCGNSETPTSEQGEESSFGEGFNWKVVMMGYACGLLVGMVAGHVIITRRPGWFSRTFGVNLRRRRRSGEGNSKKRFAIKDLLNLLCY